MVWNESKRCRNPEDVARHFASMTKEARQTLSERGVKEHLKEHEEFRNAFVRGQCYLCEKALDTVDEKNPCAHWLLRIAKFQKRSFPRIFKKFGYDNLDCYLRWVANEERHFTSINDLAEEKAEGKVFQYTIRWKNIEWTFDCSDSDFKGHRGEYSNFPHYHFQMKIDDQRFINFSDFHIPFSEYDLLILSLEREHCDLFIRWSPGGSGMQDAVTIDPEAILKGTSPTENEHKAVYQIQTIIDNSEGLISTDALMELREKSKRSDHLLSYLLQQRFGDQADIKTFVSPADSVPEIAKRTSVKR